MVARIFTPTIDSTTLPSNRFVPIIGDILIGVWKVNMRNAALLEEFLRVRGEEYLKGGGKAIGEGAFISVCYYCIIIRWQGVDCVDLFRLLTLWPLRILFSEVTGQPLVGHKCPEHIKEVTKITLLLQSTCHSNHIVTWCCSSLCSSTHHFPVVVDMIYIVSS